MLTIEIRIKRGATVMIEGAWDATRELEWTAPLHHGIIEGGVELRGFTYTPRTKGRSVPTRTPESASTSAPKPTKKKS